MRRPEDGQPPADRSASDQRPVLYVVVCGSPVARHVGRLVTLAERSGWQVWVISTPDGRKFIDVPALADLTGKPVRSEYKCPGDPDLMPVADAIVVAPATVNTVNKWACGIADTLALGLLVEAYGMGVPTVAMPYTNTAMAVHPAFLESLDRLRTWGVEVLFGEDVMAMPPPRAGAGYATQFPWQLPLTVLGPATRRQGRLGWPVAGADPPVAAHRGRHTPSRGRALLAPPASPRPAPAIVRTS